MTYNLSKPLLGIPLDTPTNVYVLKHRTSDSFWCRAQNRDSMGVICFTSEYDAKAYAMSNTNDVMAQFVIERMHFDTARAIVKRINPKNLGVTGLCLYTPHTFTFHHVL